MIIIDHIITEVVLRESMSTNAILERLVEWENANNQEVLQEAKAEILKLAENLLRKSSEIIMSEDSKDIDFYIQ